MFNDTDMQLQFRQSEKQPMLLGAVGGSNRRAAAQNDVATASTAVSRGDGVAS
jgi:hypothetical protein